MSDHFIVSARKYRPQTFNTVVGQGHITTTLKNAIAQQQLAHAFLFCGPRGVGKTTCARILAKTINCEKRTKEGEACNKCEPCLSFEKGASFNIHELDAASNNSVDDIRSLVEQVRYAPQAGEYKVYIIDEVHMLSSGAFNAFLKTLEEPPSYAIFILATTEKHKILPTILSRCQIFDFKRITTSDTVEHLQEIVKKEKIKAETAALHVIAEKSEGCLRDALSILDKIVSFTEGKLTYANTLEHLNILDEDYFFRLLDSMLQQKTADALVLYQEIHHRGFEGETLLDGFAEFIRNLLVCKDPASASLLLVPEDFKPRYIERAGEVDLGWLMTALNIVSETIVQHRLARNKKLHIELWLIKMTMLQQAIQVVAGDSGSLKKKLTQAYKGVSFRPLPVSKISGKNQMTTVVSETNQADAPVLIIKKESESKLPVPTHNSEQVIETGIAPKPLSSLKKIREQLSGKTQLTQEVKLLEMESLQQAWADYMEGLKSRQNLPAATAFEMASLTILDEALFEINTTSKLHFKFFEAERAMFSQHIQAFFNNNNLKFQLRLNEEVQDQKEVNVPLNQKELYRELSEQYPLLKNLKDRLHLDLGLNKIHSDFVCAELLLISGCNLIQL